MYQKLISKKVSGNLISNRVPLESAFNEIPEHCWQMIQFRLAYSYRHQFCDAEIGSEEDPTGLVAAVSRALSFSVGFTSKELYIRSGKGIENVLDAEKYLDGSVDNRSFKASLYDAVRSLPERNVHLFFESLGLAVINHKLSAIKCGYPLYHQKQKIVYDPGKVRGAVKLSLLNYARMATLGVYDEEAIPSGEIEAISEPAISHNRIKQRRKTTALRPFDFNDEEEPVTLLKIS